MAPRQGIPDIDDGGGPASASASMESDEENRNPSWLIENNSLHSGARINRLNIVEQNDENRNMNTIPYHGSNNNFRTTDNGTNNVHNIHNVHNVYDGSNSRNNAMGPNIDIGQRAGFDIDPRIEHLPLPSKINSHRSVLQQQGQNHLSASAMRQHVDRLNSAAALNLRNHSLKQIVVSPDGNCM